jgi:hypothetical protein
MARVIEPLDSQQELNLQGDEELVNIDEQFTSEKKAAEKTQATAKQQEEQQESTIPEKYQGKSIEEIVQMHQEAEKLVGRQSSEVGELRKIVDDFIKTKVEETKQEVSPQQDESVNDLDFFENPKEAITKAISSSDEVKQMRELLASQQQQTILSKLNEKHPDYVDIVQDGEFAEWVKASQVRMELLKRADAYDFSAADELLSTWKQLSGVREVSKQDRKQQIKAASTGSGKGSGEPTTRKIYRRSDIVNLMIKDPERYKANVEEFDRAYREGRVK